MTEEVREENQTELEENEVEDVVTEEPEPGEVTASEEGPLQEVSLEEKLQQLETQLAEAEQKAAEYFDALQRSQASFANYRKRTENEQISWRSVANAALLSRFLPVLDDFERAFQALPQDLKEHPWVGGITLIQRKIAGILESENVTPIELQPGDTFDPLYHQAVLHQEVPGFEDGQIVAEVERGYVLGERVLRPASVVVAKVPPRAPEPEPEAEPEVVEAEVVDAEVVEDEVVCCGDGEPCDGQDPA